VEGFKTGGTQQSCGLFRREAQKHFFCPPVRRLAQRKKNFFQAGGGMHPPPGSASGPYLEENLLSLQVLAD